MASDKNEVGFGKPPKGSQFQKGASGNPKGRPKGTRNLATVLARALQEKVIITKNGRQKTMTKLDAAIAQLVDQAASGNLVAMRQLVALVSSTEDQFVEPPKRQSTEADLKVMQNVLKRLKGYSQEDKDENQDR